MFLIRPRFVFHAVIKLLDLASCRAEVGFMNALHVAEDYKGGSWEA